MLNGKYVSIERVISGVQRDFKFNTEFDWVDAVEWTGDYLSLLGTAGQYVEKVTDGNTDVDFSWYAVKRILDNGGTFKS